MPDETFVSVDDLRWQKIITSKILKTVRKSTLSQKQITQIVSSYHNTCIYVSPQSTFKMKVVCFCQFTGTTSQVMGVDTDINQSFKVSLQTEVGKMEQLSQSHDENQWHRIVLHSKTGYLIRTRRACPSFEAPWIFLEPARRNIYIYVFHLSPRANAYFVYA